MRRASRRDRFRPSRSIWEPITPPIMRPRTASSYRPPVGLARARARSARLPAAYRAGTGTPSGAVGAGGTYGRAGDQLLPGGAVPGPRAGATRERGALGHRALETGHRVL